MSMEATLHVLKYIGGKGRMAGVLSRLIPSTCKVYAEMYCGSAALALNSGKFDVKILNDFNPHIANFWKVATAPETQGLLLERLQQTCYSWSLFQAAKERHEAYGAKQNDPIQWAADTYIIINQSFNADGRAWVYNDGRAYTINLATKQSRISLPKAGKSGKIRA